MGSWKHDFFTGKFKHIPDHLQLVSIGTSQAHFALDFSDSEIPAFNMAVYLNPFTYCKLLLEKYQKKIAPGASILITLEYPIFLCGDVKGTTMENALQYSKILFGRDPNVPMIQQCIYRILPDYFWSNADFSWFRYLEQRNRRINHYKTWELEGIIRDLVKDGWEKTTGCENLLLLGTPVSEYHNSKMQKIIYDIVDLIGYCRSKGWIPLLVSLPFSKFFNSRIPEPFKEYYFYQCINEIMKRTGCGWLDYSRDERMEDINYYLNVWFLNERGRKRFTRIVLDEYGSVK